ncbi:MAG: penicillin acylase family protein [Gemmatimonadales bacterium]
MPRRTRGAVSRWGTAGIVALSGLIGGVHDASSQRGPAGEGAPLRARISTTAYGVPHVSAENLAGVGFGHGYAIAATDLCTIADRWVTVRAERSRFFGIEGRRDGRQTVTNLQSDFYWQWLIDRDIVGEELRQPPPSGPIPEVREIVRGYVAGYNHYLEQVGVANLPDSRCRGQDWVRPISERDVYLRALHTAMMLNANWIGPTVDAVRPGHGPSGPRASLPPEEAAPRLTMSNVIALGRDATDNGKGMVFINPHWRWHEPERFFEVHLTVPGVLDVYGGTFSGIPLVLLGFNRNVAWSHTASVPRRETVYQLRLMPGDPTAYQYEGTTRRMTPREVSVEVKEADGRLTRKRHTYWETNIGPFIANARFVWTPTTAYAVRIVSTSFRWLNQHYEMNAARSAEALDLAGKRYLGLGWLNTIAADDQGRVIYGDRSSVPHVTDAMRADCVTSDLGKELWGRQQLLVFDGWRKACEWGTDPDAPVPGIFGPKRLPMLARWDYATNSNDSHWANHADHPLEGFDAIVGDERTPRSLRTRAGLHKIQGRLRGTDGRVGQRFSLADLETITMDNRVYSAELWRDPLVAYCRTLPVQKGIPEACDVLAGWDMTDNLDSPGAVLWRRFMENITPAAQPEADLFATPFDPKDPIGTPRGLNAANPRVGRALAAAISNLRDSGIPLAAKLRDYQIEERAGHRIPIHGGPVPTGQYNLVMNGSGWVPGKGWSTIVHATSYVAWVQYTDRGPVGRSLLASSQSDDPDSPHHADQTLLFSRKESKPILFDQKDIEADPSLKVLELCRTAAGRSCQGN